MKNDLLPVIIQDDQTLQVLMLGYMNAEAIQQTQKTGWVTFYSRSKKRLWVKGETSGNKLKLISMTWDCDQDAILIFAEPMGPVCHGGTVSCFDKAPLPSLACLLQLEKIIHARALNPSKTSYTAQLLQSGIARIAQKVGEEGVEVALASVHHDGADLNAEAADLIFHLLVLLCAKKSSLSKVTAILQQRMQTFHE